MRARGCVPLALAAAAMVSLGACGGSSHKAATSTTVSSTTASTGSAAASGSSGSAFCQQFTTFAEASTAAGGDTTLAQARTDYATVVTDADAITGPPAAISSDMQSAVVDVRAINTWVQTQATQAELNGTAVPAAVAAPFNDLQSKGQTIDNYAKAHCPSFP